MTIPWFLLAILIVAAAALGGVVVWYLRGLELQRLLDDADSTWRSRFDRAVDQKQRYRADSDALKASSQALQESLDAERAVIKKHKHLAALGREQLDSLRETISALEKDLAAARQNQSNLQSETAEKHQMIQQIQKKLAMQQEHFAKSREQYDAQIETALKQHTDMEQRIEAGKIENESLRKLLLASKAEQESMTSLLDTAQFQLKSQNDLDAKYVAQQAENAELREAVTAARQEAEALQRNAAEFDALKMQNVDLSHCLRSMESSRRQYEEDARRYREQLEEAQRELEPLQQKIHDLERSHSEYRYSVEPKALNGQNYDHSTLSLGIAEPDGEIDDLTEIIGIGKVFAATLNKLGIYHFRQLAAFGPDELAQVKSEIREFRGRIENDDWIGQAKELQFRKYGNNLPL